MSRRRSRLAPHPRGCRTPRRRFAQHRLAGDPAEPEGQRRHPRARPADRARDRLPAQLCRPGTGRQTDHDRRVGPYGSSKMQADSFYDPILGGLRRALEDADYDLLLFAPTRPGRQPRSDRADRRAAGWTDGLIGTQTDREAVTDAHGRAPLVHVGRRDFGSDVPTSAPTRSAGSTGRCRTSGSHGHGRIALSPRLELRADP